MKNKAPLALMEQLVEGYLPLSHAIARRFIGHGVELEDLQQVARIAVVGALERFDPTKEIRFKTFAYRTVSGKIMNYYRDSTWRVAIPRKYREIRRIAKPFSQRKARLLFCAA